MIPKRFGDLTFAHIESLVTSGTREGRSLEFKRDQVGGKEEDRREFLADVSAMANSYGGDIVFGVEASAGVAMAANGMKVTDPDAEMLRLHQILQSGLEPRLAQIEMRWLPRATDRGALVIRTQVSLSGPHRVIFRDHAKFYARHSAGKFPMDTFQLRAAFAASESVPERIRNFHQEQVGRAVSDDHVLPLHVGPLAALHLVPLSSLTAPMELRFGLNDHVAPPGTSVYSSMPAFEGVVTYSGPDTTVLEGVRTFTLLHRSGTLEVFAAVGRSNSSEVGPKTLEINLTESVKVACRAAVTFGISGPFGLAFSLARMQGATLLLGHEYSVRPIPCRRSVLTFPMLLLDEARVDEAALVPIKEMMWNAFGVERPSQFNPR